MCVCLCGCVHTCVSNNNTCNTNAYTSCMVIRTSNYVSRQSNLA